MSSIGVFGGTFDPPHLGHLILAQEAAVQLKLDQVLWLLTPAPPHKQGKQIVPLAHRLAMLELTIARNPLFELSRVDIDRPPPYFAVDTMRMLRQSLSVMKDKSTNVFLVYLIGSDSLRDLPTWHRPQELVEACSALGVMCRPGVKINLDLLESKLPGLRARLKWINAPQIEISSSYIRQLVATGKPFRYYVTESVAAYIREHCLYATD